MANLVFRTSLKRLRLSSLKIVVRHHPTVEAKHDTLVFFFLFVIEANHVIVTMTLSGPMQMAYFLASVLHGYCTRAIARAMLLLNSGVSWCAFLFSMASGPSSTIFEALAWREVLKVLMHDCR